MRCYHAVGLQIIDRPPPSEQEFMTARTVMFILRLVSWGFFLRLFTVRYVIRACNTAVNVMAHWGSHFEVSCQDRWNTDHTQYTQTLLLKFIVEQTSRPNVHLEWPGRRDKTHSHSTLRVNGRDKWRSDPSFRVNRWNAFRLLHSDWWDIQTPSLERLTRPDKKHITPSTACHYHGVVTG